MAGLDRTDRIRGCAVGAAIGDALGMPLEFHPPRPSDHQVVDMIAGRLPAGTFTDDTEMALALADSLLFKKPLVGQDLAERWTDWYRSSPPDIGIQTRLVLGWINEGLDWETASQRLYRTKPQNAGNGSLMRCWPVALAWADDPSMLVTDTVLQSKITHPHPDCISACVMLNSMIAMLVQGADRQEAFEDAMKLARLSLDFDLLLRHAFGRKRQELQNSGWVRHTLETAVWAFLSTDSFEDALVSAANLGNDADTGAAVTGALAGAYYGLAAIPPQWRKALRGEWPSSSGVVWSEKEFIQTADRLAGLIIGENLD